MESENSKSDLIFQVRREVKVIEDYSIQFNKLPRTNLFVVNMFDKERIQVLLKEWELCQDNMKRHTDWIWHTGSIFILLSIAALWALVQIGDVLLRQKFFGILCGFSVLTLIIWYFAIVVRARKWVSISRSIASEIETELQEVFDFKDPLLHTRIQISDKGSKLTGHRGTLLFISLVFVIWILTGLAVFT